MKEFFEMLQTWFPFASWSTAQKLQVADMSVLLTRLHDAVASSQSYKQRI